MADQNHQIEQEIRNEIKRAKKGPKRWKKERSARTALLVLLLLALLGTAGYLGYRGVDSADGIRRLLSYNKIEQSADGRVEAFRYDSDRSASYAMLGDALLVVSTTRIQLLALGGDELWSKTVNFTNPAMTHGSKTAAVYDVGGHDIYVFDTRGLLRDMSGESGNGILSASLNASDYLALTTLKSGYRTAVTAYDPSGEPVFTFNSSERYLSEARVLDDNRHLAAVTLGEADGVFASTLTFYAFDREESVSDTTFRGEMVLALDSVGGKLSVLVDGRVMLFDADGSLAGSRRFEFPYLRGVSTDGDGFAALLLSRYRSGGALRLMTLDHEGSALGTLDERREVVDLSAAGRYVAVLYSDSLTIFRSDLSVYATLESSDFAKQVIMRPDGTALLLGASRAWLYIPE